MGLLVSADTLLNEQMNQAPLLFGIIEHMGLAELIDTCVQPHGAWQGASVGTLVSVWLCRILAERDHRLVAVRDWVAQRTATFEHLLDQPLRETDFSDDRLANVLTMLGQASTQARLDEAMTQRWLRLYRLPTETVRLDSTSVSVYHEPADAASLLQVGHSKDHRPDLRQFKAMLATLDPLGLPLVCQTVAGHRADAGLYVPAYEAAIEALGTCAVLVVGDSKMGALATRGRIAAGGSTYLCVYRPGKANAELATWREQALEREATWQHLTAVDPKTGEVLKEVVIDEWQRPQKWVDPETQRRHRWTERVLVTRSSTYQAGLRRRRERALARLSATLDKLRLPPVRGRKRYQSRQALDVVVTRHLAQAGFSGVVHYTLSAERLANGTTRWIVAAYWVHLEAWQARVARLGWQVYVSNTTSEQYEASALVASYHQQSIEERGLSRLKTRHLRIRPVYVRDETRIAGLLWLLSVALRVLTLTEYRLRTALAEPGEALAGLNPASRAQTTAHPTTERVVAAFDHVTLTILEGEEGHALYITPLTATQRHILDLLGLPDDLYERLKRPLDNLVLHLRE